MTALSNAAIAWLYEKDAKGCILVLVRFHLRCAFQIDQQLGSYDNMQRLTICLATQNFFMQKLASICFQLRPIDCTDNKMVVFSSMYPCKCSFMSRQQSVYVCGREIWSQTLLVLSLWLAMH